jgi:7-cyano-7-deazaguanine synthase
MAKSQGYEVYALSFDYGQTNVAELKAASQIARQFSVAMHRIIKLPLGDFGASALTDDAIDVPDYSGDETIPVTYVPARNTVFLSMALAWAESLLAYDIFFAGCDADYDGYPDCRPEYFSAFQTMANLGTKAGVNGEKLSIHTPLTQLTKAQTILTGLKLGVDYSVTVTCYRADQEGFACGECYACYHRKKGFAEANVEDVTRYKR